MEQVFYRSNYPYPTSKNNPANWSLIQKTAVCNSTSNKPPGKKNVVISTDQMYFTAAFPDFLESWDSRNQEKVPVTVGSVEAGGGWKQQSVSWHKWNVMRTPVLDLRTWEHLTWCLPWAGTDWQLSAGWFWSVIHSMFPHGWPSSFPGLVWLSCSKAFSISPTPAKLSWELKMGRGCSWNPFPAQRPAHCAPPRQTLVFALALSARGKPILCARNVFLQFTNPSSNDLVGTHIMFGIYVLWTHKTTSKIVLTDV